jgi:3-hydroxybutyrate dehydrogenase
MTKKVAVITGAASGLGKAIAEKFSKEGFSVAIIDLDLDKAQKTAKELEVYGSKNLAVKMDVSSEQDVISGIQLILKTLHRIDILVSNAGIQMIESLEKFSFEKWKKMMAVHLDGAFLLTKECLKHFYANNEGGSIIYMGSVHSKLASLLKAPYVTAKHGLEGLTKAVAKEGAPHQVKCNLVCPGFVLTPLVEKQIPEQAKELNMSEEDVIKKVMLKDTVDGEFTTAEDIAEVVFFLSTFKTLALTGQSLIVSHGWYME